MLARIKTFIKNNFSWFYNTTRSLIFPVYVELRRRGLRSFKENRYIEVSVSGINFKIKVNPENGFIDEEIFFKGVYEEDILGFIRKKLQKGDVFLDIGANIGEHSLFASKIVGGTGKIFAFEPNKNIYDQFKESIICNNLTNIQVFNFGIGIENKKEKFFINTENAGGSSLLNYKKGLREIEIEVKNGDEVIKYISGDEKIDFIKIDVEGFEYEVLAGLQNTIGRFKPKILLEYSPAFYKERSRQNKVSRDYGNEILSFLVSQNYKFQDLESGDSATIFEGEEAILAWGRRFTKDQTNIFCFVN